MTTIVYNHESKQIACESQCTRNETAMSLIAEKYKFIGGDTWFFSGPTCDFSLFVDAHTNNNKLDSEVIGNVGAIRVSNGVAYLLGIDNGYVWESVMENNDGVGSGSLFALSALDFKSTVKKAVEYACTRDIYSGGKVHVYDIATDKFIEEG